MRGSDYAELRAFAAVVRHGSFSRAAVHLGLSPSALSQTIRALEDRLGQRLLNRTTRSVAPSPAGQVLAARLLPVLDDLDSARALGGKFLPRLRAAYNELAVAQVAARVNGTVQRSVSGGVVKIRVRF